MNQRPILLSLTTMHQSGLQILRDSTELRHGQRLWMRQHSGARLSVPMRSSSVPAGLSTRLSWIGATSSRSWAGTEWARSDRRPSRYRPRHPGRLQPSANTQSVAEHVFALMIGLSGTFPE